MQIEQGTKPEALEITDLPDGTTEISFTENVQQQEDGYYTYELYQILVPTRTSLREDVEKNFQKWLDYAKQHHPEE